MSEKEDKEATTTQHLTQQQTDKHNHTSGPTTTKRVDQQQPHRLAQPTATTGPTHGNNWPLPLPLPRREGRNHRDTPNVLPLVAYGAVCGCIIPCSAHSISYLRYIKILVNGVYSVILCLYVILSLIMFASRGGGVFH